MAIGRGGGVAMAGEGGSGTESVTANTTMMLSACCRSSRRLCPLQPGRSTGAWYLVSRTTRLQYPVVHDKQAIIRRRKTVGDTRLGLLFFLLRLRPVERSHWSKEIVSDRTRREMAEGEAWALHWPVVMASRDEDRGVGAEGDNNDKT